MSGDRGTDAERIRAPARSRKAGKQRSAPRGSLESLPSYLDYLLGKLPRN
jgi:hypothetical protein